MRISVQIDKFRERWIAIDNHIFEYDEITDDFKNFIPDLIFIDPTDAIRLFLLKE